MTQITSNISIGEDEIHVDFVRSPGPGGQNVNKVATSAQLRFDIANSPSLPDEIKQRLIGLGGKRVSEAGVLIIQARRYRTQPRNRQDALDRLVSLISRAAKVPKVRRPTKPTAASRKRRLESKKQRSQTKHLRRAVGGDETD